MNVFVAHRGERWGKWLAYDFHFLHEMNDKRFWKDGKTRSFVICVIKQGHSAELKKVHLAGIQQEKEIATRGGFS